MKGEKCGKMVNKNKIKHKLQDRDDKVNVVLNSGIKCIGSKREGSDGEVISASWAVPKEPGPIAAWLMDWVI